jgi:hypothetical protein
MGVIEFLVKGSTEDPYRVSFAKDGDNLTCLCNCKAGSMGQICKHRTRIFEGELTGVVSENLDDVSTVREWLKGTDVEEALASMEASEAYLFQAKERLKQSKKMVAQAMND